MIISPRTQLYCICGGFCAFALSIWSLAEYTKTFTSEIGGLLTFIFSLVFILFLIASSFMAGTFLHTWLYVPTKSVNDESDYWMRNYVLCFSLFSILSLGFHWPIGICVIIMGTTFFIVGAGIMQEKISIEISKTP